MRGYNDDLTMALAIGCWIRDTALTVNNREVEYKKACLASIVKVDTRISTTIPGMTNHDRKKAIDEKMFQAQDDYTKYSWLIKG